MGLGWQYFFLLFSIEIFECFKNQLSIICLLTSKYLTSHIFKYLWIK